ncbi:hypothetical protein DFJ58DRAFT_659021, partial [Suillus subalutaceus]|uniref:uncharacterized protein n=1 Tax=Suillus subalutaceus TaxID=48586 RepID=UPI001B8656F7
LLIILISESAHLIWTLRCEGVIRDAKHNEETVIKRCQHAIDKRLQLDRAIASKSRRDTKAAMRAQATWINVIDDTALATPPNNWVP